MKVLVCGGRDYWQKGPVFAALDELKPTHIISGGAAGADNSALDWAADRNVPFSVFPADWIGYGRSAGPLRNQQMLNEGKPDMVLAFPGGRGTADMVRRAEKAGVPVRLVEQQSTSPYPFVSMGVCIAHGPWRRTASMNASYGCPVCSGEVERPAPPAKEQQDE